MTAETRKGRSNGAAPAGVSLEGRSPAGLGPLARLVRRHDRDRYQTALFAPPDRREALFALYAFNYEVARVRESVSQPMLGQIRLQWWREVVEAAFAGAPSRRHEVALPLTAAIRNFGLDRMPFDRMLDAREADLADQAPADMAGLEAYAEGTSAAPILLALQVLGVRDEAARGSAAQAAVHGAAEAAARHIGAAYAMAGLLRAMPFHARAGRCYIPNEIAAATGLDAGDYAAMRASPALRQAVATIAEAAASHLATARRLRPEVPAAALPALLPAVVAGRALVRLRGLGWNPFEPRLAGPDPLQIWRLAAAALRRRF